MKLKIEGMSIQDSDVNREFVYFLLAYYFHWTPSQVDEMDGYMVESLLLQLPLWIKKTGEVRTDGRTA